MRKVCISLLLSFVMLPFSIILANPVSEEDARNVAVAFMEKHFKNRNNASFGIRRAYGKASVSSPLNEKYYVFNATGTQGGYVIVATDDRLPEILGYSDKGYIDMDNMPPNMRAWLSQYDHVMNQAEDTFAMESPKGPKGFSSWPSAFKAKHDISPMITTKWGQEAPFNDLAPEIDGQRAVTGCVATAMAQIMYYHRWPDTETTMIPQYGYGEELPPTAFDWENMLDVYDGSENEEQRMAVAKLMRYAGQAAKMQYGVDGSGAFSFSAIRALMENFGYSKQMKYVKHRDYTAEEWEKIVYHELQEGRPVFYSGYSPWEGGHAFVCDGYAADGNYYHFNWGWDGDSDGYFLMEYPQTAAGMITVEFSKEHIIITGIQKSLPYEQTEETVRMRTQDLKLETDKQTYTRTDINKDFKGIRIEEVQSEELIGNYQIDLGIGVYEGENLLQVAEMGSYNSRDDRKDIIYDFTTTIALGAGIGDGNYQLRPVSKFHGSEEWIIDQEGDAHFIEAVISGNELNVFNVIHGEKLKINSIRFLGMVDNMYSYQLDITNEGPLYSGNLWMLGYFDDEEGYYIFSDWPVSIGANEHRLVEVHTSAPADWYDHYQISLDSKGNHVIYENNAVEGQEEMLTAVGEIENAIGNRVVGGIMRMHAKVTNNGTELFDRYISAQLWEKNVLGFIGINERKFIRPGETIDCYYTFVLQEGMFDSQKGTDFCIDLSYGGRRREKPLVRTPYYKLSSGVLYWQEDGTAVVDTLTEHITVPERTVSVDLHYAERKYFDLHPNDNPNCLYVFNRDATIPACLEGCNIVKDFHSDEIRITDENAFFSPVDFTTSHICYTRNFKDTSWSTMTVPFHVSKDQLTDLYVKEFVQEEDGELYFDDAEYIRAYDPYMVSSKRSSITLTANDIDLSISTPSCIRGNHYSFYAYTLPYKESEVFFLNTDGNAFVKAEDEIPSPFRGFFCQNEKWIEGPDELKIHIAGSLPAEPVGIQSIDNEKSATAKGDGAVYDLQGRKVITNYELRNTSAKFEIRNSELKPGIYIINGKKVVVK